MEQLYLKLQQIGRTTGTILKVGAIGGLGVYTAYHSLYNVPPGCKAIVFDRFEGIRNKVYPEGLHFVIPWIERHIVFDVRARPYTVESASGTQDLQIVDIGLRVLFRPKQDELPRIYRNLGKDYDDRVLPSITHETLKSVVALYTASELITQRENVSRQIRKELTKQAAAFFMEVDDVSITGLTFSKEYNESVEAKQIAQQEVERTKFVVEKAEQEKKAAIIRAQGEAKSAQLIGSAVSDNEAFLALRHIEASKDTAEVMSDAENKVYLASDNLLIDLKSLDLKGLKGSKK